MKYIDSDKLIALVNKRLGHTLGAKNFIELVEELRSETYICPNCGQSAMIIEGHCLNCDTLFKI